MEAIVGFNGRQFRLSLNRQIVALSLQSARETSADWPSIYGIGGNVRNVTLDEKCGALWDSDFRTQFLPNIEWQLYTMRRSAPREVRYELQGGHFTFYTVGGWSDRPSLLITKLAHPAPNSMRAAIAIHPTPDIRVRTPPPLLGLMIEKMGRGDLRFDVSVGEIGSSSHVCILAELVPGATWRAFREVCLAIRD